MKKHTPKKNYYLDKRGISHQKQSLAKPVVRDFNRDFPYYPIDSSTPKHIDDINTFLAQGYTCADLGYSYYVSGDVNGDGLINILDIIAHVNAILDTGIGVGLHPCANAYDFTGDGQHNVLDIVNTVNYILDAGTSSYVYPTPYTDIDTNPGSAYCWDTTAINFNEE